MALDPPVVAATAVAEDSGLTSGSTTASITFTSPPSKDAFVVISIGANVSGGTPQTPTILAPDLTELCNFDSDTTGGPGERWGVWYVKASGYTSTYSVTITWDGPSDTLDWLMSGVAITGVDPSSPITDSDPGMDQLGSSATVVIGDIITGGANNDAVLNLLHVTSNAVNHSFDVKGLGSGTIATTALAASLFTGNREHVAWLSVLATAGSSGSTHLNWTNAGPSSAFSMILKAGLAQPDLGSLIGYPDLAWTPTYVFAGSPWSQVDDGTYRTSRMLTWGNVRRKISDKNRGFSNGLDAIEIADTDQEVWGSIYGANGTSILWRQFQIDQIWRNSIYGTVQGTKPLAIGRVVEFEYRENKVKLGLYDGIEDISNSQFIWDYVPLLATIPKPAPQTGDFYYGTVVSVHGSIIITEESSEHHLRKNLNSIENLDINRRTFTEKWMRLGNLGAIGTDSLVSGDRVKFHSTYLPRADAGSVLLGEPEYSVQSGSFYVSQTSARSGTYGTIILHSAPVGVNRGDYIFKRYPLWFRGNPAEIVYQILTGTNSTLRMPTTQYNATFYGAATRACAAMNFEAMITDEGQGGPINALKQISEAVDAVYFFDRQGSFCWIPFRPRQRGDVDIVANKYFGTTISGVGTGNMWNAQYSEDVSDILTDVTINFNYNHFEDEEAPQWRGQVKRQNLNTSTYYRGYRNAATLDSKWITELDDAIVIAERKLRMATVARAKYSFDTSLYGYEQDLFDLLQLTHRTGSMANKAWQVDEIDHAVDEDRITIRLRDITDVYFGKGYGYFEDGDLGANVVSGTSNAGWGWVSGSTGTTGTGIELGSLGLLVELWDVNGVRPNIGTEGETRWITVGSEVIWIAGSTGDTATFSIGTRGADLSNVGTFLGSQWAWTALPEGTHGDLYALYNGTEFNGTGPFGTVHNINSATFGTVWRFW